MTEEKLFCWRSENVPVTRKQQKIMREMGITCPHGTSKDGALKLIFAKLSNSEREAAIEYAKWESEILESATRGLKDRE